MPRMNAEEFAADLAAIKVEGYEEARSLVEKLVESGLSLAVAQYALAERGRELEALRVAAFEKAQASRVEPAPVAEKPATLPVD